MRVVAQSKRLIDSAAVGVAVGPATSTAATMVSVGPYCGGQHTIYGCVGVCVRVPMVVVKYLYILLHNVNLITTFYVRIDPKKQKRPPGPRRAAIVSASSSAVLGWFNTRRMRWCARDHHHHHVDVSD